jgi:UDP-N-acetylglucosamine 4,6-dehydratase/5-epimerase
MEDKTILIFGQSGTFGTAVTKQLLQMGVKAIIGYDRDEKNQYLSKQAIDDKRITRVIGDIRDKEAVDNVIKTYKPEIVMLSSAMKHIDKCQAFPDECRKTNIDGCINVINSAIDHNVEKLVFLSTDKATNPTTIYGCSKLFIEMYIQNVDSRNTTLLTTRYGNVLGSNGSVLDIWRKQADKGEALTITNPHITRFFMPISGEYGATDLVLYALENGQNKDLWIYKNKSCTIKDLADLISDNQIETGLRCIEKNDEALATVNELNHSKIHKDIYYQINKNIQSEVIYTEPLNSDNAERLTREELLEMMSNV